MSEPSSNSGAFFLLCWVVCIVATIIIVASGNAPH